MNENIEQLGKPQLLPSKSLLNTLNLGYQIKPDVEKPENNILFKEKGSLITTMDTGFEHDDKPVQPKPIISCDSHKNPDSIISNVDTGFGCNNILNIECPKPKYKTHLCKENYLNEFKSEQEKTLVRYNIGVYSKKEVDNLVIESLTSFITKEEVQVIVDNLDYVKSTLKSQVDYQIPDKLFK